MKKSIQIAGINIHRGRIQRSADLEHGDLNDLELKQLEAFLGTLSSPLEFAE
jgi:hypothetical protein